MGSAGMVDNPGDHDSLDSLSLLEHDAVSRGANDEAAHLRQRVEELEDTVRRLERELREAKARVEAEAGPDSERLRQQAEAAEDRARDLETRCRTLEQEVPELSGGRKMVAGGEAGGPARGSGSNRTDHAPRWSGENSGGAALEDGSWGGGAAGEKLRRQLEVAERRVQNSRYISEAHEALAAEASARERAAEARASEYGRRLQRALERLEAAERRARVGTLAAECAQREEDIRAAEGEVRALHSDPELALPSSTAKRRALARAERRLAGLRHRHTQQTAVLRHSRGLEDMHEKLQTAAACGDGQTVCDVLATACSAGGGLSPNTPDKSGFSALLYACGQADAAVVCALVAVGGDVLDGEGRTTGLIIASARGHEAVVAVLLEEGADTAGYDSFGGTALHAAAAAGHLGAAKLLLRAGADCNRQDQAGNSPLHTVAATKNTALASLLLEWGASVTLKNAEGYTSLGVALAAKNRAMVLAHHEFLGEDYPSVEAAAPTGGSSAAASGAADPAAMAGQADSMAGAVSS